MKKLKLYIIFSSVCLLLHTPCFSQNKDSLWAIYRNTAEADTNRLKAINEIANLYRDNNPSTAIVLAQQELRLAEKIHQKKYIGKALNFIGVLNKNKGIYPTALEYFLKALKLFEEVNAKKDIGNCYANIGNVYYDQTEYIKALSYYGKALKVREEIKDKRGVAICYGNFGNVYSSKGDFEKALEYDLKSLKMREEIGDKQGQAFCYNNIGIIYKNKKDNNKALKCYFKCLKIIKEVGDKQGIGYCFNNIGNTFIDLVNYKLALQYCDSSLQFLTEIGDIYGERTAYENLSNIYAKTNRYKEAYTNYVKFKTLTDSIFNTENSEQMGDMKTSFEVDKKESELKAKADTQRALTAEEEKRQNVIIYAVAGLLLLVIIFSLFLYKRYVFAKKQKQTIEYLFKEVHHRVKNNLQVITSLLNLQKNYIEDKKILAIFQDCQNRIYAMSAIHEKLYENNALSNINVKNYIENLIIQLIDTYQLTSFDVKYQIDVNIDPLDLDTLIPIGLLTNEIISNSLKYAFPGHDKNNVITFKLQKNTSDSFIITIGDNGKGFETELNEKHSTFGLELIAILASQLHGTIRQLPEHGTMYEISCRL
jgi:two-component sensor histidine kinase